MENCLFCKIIKGEIPADKVYEDQDTLAFKDISPQAPTHLLVIPKEHYVGIHEIPEDKKIVMERLLSTVSSVVLKEGLTNDGYRLVVNFGEKANQTVPHIHIHILSGRSLTWPPG